MPNRKDIRTRDPFIVAHNGIYYLYCATGSKDGNTIVAYRSCDLEEWDEPVDVYTLSTDTWKEAELWAPEVHLYRDKFYLFLSIKGKNGLRGTEISVADTPMGPFLPISDRAATPLDKSCIDGTLFVDGDVPYIVYSRDWPDHYVATRDAYVGQISAQQLSEDLTTPIGDAFLLFESTDCPYSAEHPAKHDWEGKDVTRFGSDAPFINRLSDGRLFLTWSPFAVDKYVVLGAVAKDIRGPWTHLDTPLYDNNGGHAMFFTTFDGVRKMCIHQPERRPDERTLILDAVEQNGQIVVQA